MTDMLSASDLRRWAARCLSESDHARCSASDRNRLLKMHATLLELANNADWLEGRSKPSAVLEICT